MDTQDEVVVKEVYLDYNGSAPLDPRVVEAMLPVLTGGIGNASASHRFGRYQTASFAQARHANQHVSVVFAESGRDMVVGRKWDRALERESGDLHVAGERIGHRPHEAALDKVGVGQGIGGGEARPVGDPRAFKCRHDFGVGLERRHPRLDDVGQRLTVREPVRVRVESSVLGKVGTSDRSARRQKRSIPSTIGRRRASSAGRPRYRMGSVLGNVHREAHEDELLP